MTDLLLHWTTAGLESNGTVLLSALDVDVQQEAGADMFGILLRFNASTPAARLQLVFAAQQPQIKRFTACHRYEPFWMLPQAGENLCELLPETQYLLCETADGLCLLLIPLPSQGVRCALKGSSAGLALTAETGQPHITCSSVCGLYAALGDDPYALVQKAAREVCTHLAMGRLRHEKSLPDFVNWFGWCTWDAFYQEVSQEKLETGLRSFAEGGVPPRTLILDDGWQSVQQREETGEVRLTSFEANQKFPGGLAPVTAMAKQKYGVKTFLVWHALNGYWGGVDGEALPGYDVQNENLNYSPDILGYGDGITKWWGSKRGVVPAHKLYQFFQDYHRTLRLQGVDGVKVDNQCHLEAVSQNQGGPVQFMQRCHEALEGSAHTHFQGRLINCMSCASEVFYSALNSNIIRTSTDFWPNRPASHGLHLYTNAQVSLWFGEFLQPDWDMFQSAHPMGVYHAAARAISGGPVYVSDKPGEHNFDLLRKLALPNGALLRYPNPALPTRDTLFCDPTTEPAALKIFNKTENHGILGLFAALYAEGESPCIEADYAPADIPGLQGEQFALYRSQAGVLEFANREERRSLTLQYPDFELIVAVPLQGEGMAPLGLLNMFSGALALLRSETDGPAAEYVFTGGGVFGAACVRKPAQVLLNGRSADFQWNNGLLTLEAPEGVHTLNILLTQA